MISSLSSHFLRKSRPWLRSGQCLKNLSELSSSDVQEDKKSSFASLLRESPWVRMGDPKGKVVMGEIYHVVEDDLYIDIGHKFPCVCKRPLHRNEFYRRGSKVRILIKSLEMSQKFLGYDKEMTLMEAEGVLLGLYNTRELR